MHSVIQRGPEEYPEFFPIAVTAVFLEFVRCQTGVEYVLYFAKDHSSMSRKSGDLLYDAEKMFVYQRGGCLVGPFQTVYECLDYWIVHVQKIEMPEN